MDFRILGELEVLHDGNPIELGSPRQRALIARLLLNPGEVVSTDRLIDDLWAGTPPEAARHSLHVYISRIRKALGTENGRLERVGVGYRLAVDADELDATMFEQAVAEGRRALARGDAQKARALLEAGLDLWRGTMLGEFADEEFARDEATRFNELRCNAVEQRIWADLELGDHAEVIDELQDLVSRNPYREGYWEQLMLALYRSARQGEALRAYQAARAALAGELGIEPGPALRNLEARILAQDPALSVDQALSPQGADGNLPLQRTSFVGRRSEMAFAQVLIDDTRLLTITGAPGSGKTRLALQLAAENRRSFDHGVYFVPLASIATPQLLESSIATALGVREAPGESALDGIKAFLSDRHLLLVLDNFEHLLPGAGIVGELLDAAPRLQVLVTSRTPLSISGEQEYAIPPMQIPPRNHRVDLDEASAYDAVELFVTRARAVDPAFELTTENAEAVARITGKVDGLPLAIELAAARIKLLGASDLLARLQERLTLLTNGPTDAPDRHRTMSDAVAWSYDLLEPAEQIVFRSLGVFRGGFSLAAAAAVSETDESTALLAIDSLLGQSLLYRPVGTGSARYAMLEVVRAFALELLDRSGGRETAAERHASYFRQYAHDIAPLLTEERSAVARQLLSSDLDNLRAAMHYSLQSGKTDIGVDIAGGIWRFWERTDQLSEGRDWLERLLAHPNTSAESRISGLEALAGLAYWQADYDTALALYTELLDSQRAEGDRAGEAETLYAMSLSASWLNDLATGERLAEEARLAYEKLGSRHGIAKALIAQATPIWFGGSPEQALDLWTEAIAMAEEVGDRVLALTGLAGLAGMTFQLGRQGEALEIAQDGVVRAAREGNTHVTVWMLDLVAAFASTHQPDLAVRLAGAADRLRTESGGGMTPEAIQIEGARTVAGRSLPTELMHKEWRLGQQMNLEDAIDLADTLGRAGAEHDR